jgi:phytoene dehydrogenase-like protein
MATSRTPVSVAVALMLSTFILMPSALETCHINGNSYSPVRTISRDFTIIGGGSSGTYSAIRLEDLGHSTVVIETTNRLGGNTQTYIDPVTGATIDYGVQVFHKFDVVVNYFARLNVSLADGDFTIPGVVTESVIRVFQDSTFHIIYSSMS